jgi:hypothetical protein
MKIIKIFLLALPLFLVSSAFAIGDYTFPQDITTDTGTFPLRDEEGKPKQLEMQKEEATEEEYKMDSFGEEKFNENVDSDKVDVTKDSY